MQAIQCAADRHTLIPRRWGNIQLFETPLPRQPPIENRVKRHPARDAYVTGACGSFQGGNERKDGRL